MDMYVRAAYGAGRPDTRAFFSRFTQGASAKTLLTIRRARSDTGKITEKCSIAGGWIELPLSSLACDARSARPECRADRRAVWVYFNVAAAAQRIPSAVWRVHLRRKRKNLRERFISSLQGAPAGDAGRTGAADRTDPRGGARARLA